MYFCKWYIISGFQKLIKRSRTIQFTEKISNLKFSTIKTIVTVIQLIRSEICALAYEQGKSRLSDLLEKVWEKTKCLIILVIPISFPVLSVPFVECPHECGCFFLDCCITFLGLVKCLARVFNNYPLVFMILLQNSSHSIVGSVSFHYKWFWEVWKVYYWPV